MVSFLVKAGSGSRLARHTTHSNKDLRLEPDTRAIHHHVGLGRTRKQGNDVAQGCEVKAHRNDTAMPDHDESI